MKKGNFVAAVVAAVAVGAGCFGFFPRQTVSDDDGRPAIIVRGGSIEFHSSDGWSRRGKSNNWDQLPSPGPNDTKGLRATKVGGTTCELAAEPRFLQVRYRETSGTVRLFNIRYAGKKVFLQSPVDLSLSADGEVLSYTADGEIVALEDELEDTQSCSWEASTYFEVVPQK